MERLAEHAERLRALHHRDELLVLPNAWDVASARLVAGQGYPAIATASAAVTASLGHEDDDCMPPDEMFAAVGRMAAAVDRPVTADVEAGYRLEPEDLIGRLLGAGAVGLNLEDTDHHGDGDFVAADAQARRLEDVKDAGREAGVDVVLNARVDTPELGEALERARLYAEAGADCLYPINLAADDIRDFAAGADLPVNVSVRPGFPTLNELRERGVARVSFGPGLQRVALGAVKRFLGKLDPEKPVYPI